MITIAAAWLTLAYFGHWRAVIYLMIMELVLLTPIQLIQNRLQKGKWW